jgi:hypothetical protein
VTALPDWDDGDWSPADAITGITLPAPAYGGEITITMQEMRDAADRAVAPLIMRYGEIQARRDAGERPDLLAAEYGVSADVVTGLRNWPDPGRRSS